jgi:UDP-N-acetylglucosamine 2-epimerase
VEKIVNTFSKIYKDKDVYAHFSKKKNPFGDGKASERIRQFLMLDVVQSFIKNYPSSAESSIPWKVKIKI